MEKLLVKNKKAFHEFHVEEQIECGIELSGTEVKSVKDRKFNFTDSYARIRDGELWLIGVHITPHTNAGVWNHEATRTRKLLAHKREIERLSKKTRERGYTLVPLDMHLKGGYVKVTIGLCKGKKLHDKRETIKQKDLKRDADREMAGR